MKEDDASPQPETETEEVCQVQVNYKSGISVILNVYEFNVKKTNLGIDITWRLADFPKPLLLNVEEIESVFQVA